LITLFGVKSICPTNTVSESWRRRTYRSAFSPSSSQVTAYPSHLKRGTLILREKPILLWDDAQGEMPSAQWVTENVAKLPFRKRQAFKALSSHGAPGAGKDEAKWKTNAFWAGGKGGIFLKTSRFNHGCAGAKNIAIHWREETKTFGACQMRPVSSLEQIRRFICDKGRTDGRGAIDRIF
jgi:hypothetical protein